jgi:SAM-dependent MidA family methyltransferase
VIANEVLDAMPVTRFRLGPSGLQRCLVGYHGDAFQWDYEAYRDPPRGLLELVAGHRLAVGYESEFHDRATAWTHSVGSILEHGLVLLIDYGFPAHEFFHPQRDQGTLMCHYRHRAHSDPLIHVGVQDITSHVNFSAIATAAREAGMDVLGYTQQAPFLLSLGLADMLPPAADSRLRERLETTAEVKKLTSPTEMGELFKVLALGRGIDHPLLGFSLLNHCDRL